MFIPISPAAFLSSAVARMALPIFVFMMKKCSAAIITSDAPIINNCIYVTSTPMNLNLVIGITCGKTLSFGPWVSMT